MHGDVPEPTLVRDEGDGGGSFVNAGSALGSFVIGPYCDFIEVGIVHAPALLFGGKGFLAGGIEGDFGAYFIGFSGGGGDFDSDDALALAQEAVDGALFAHFDAACARVVEHHLIELGALYLPSLGDCFLVVTVEEIKRLGTFSVGLNEAHAVFFHEVRFLHLGDEPESFEGAEGEGNERLSDVVSGEFFAFEKEDAVMVFSENRSRTRASGAASDDDSVVFSFHNLSVRWVLGKEGEVRRDLFLG